MRNATREEFFEYAKGLNLNDMERITALLVAYYDDYLAIPEEEKDHKDLAYYKYMCLFAKYGPQVLYFADSVIAFRKQLELDLNEIEKEKLN